ncbi:drebrin-like protein [Procambarus clarkii]|uniref:drebrin-like protein n=1 Tax=Procambarus clarkii TaxID=6728 RepID=UPI0037433217
MREREAALRKEEQEREAALVKEALHRKEREAALRKEKREQEATLLREREREQLEARKRDPEIQRAHSKQLADSALEYRQQELALETTHHTQRQQATASLPISFNVSHTKKKPTTSDVRSRLTPTASYIG